LFSCGGGGGGENRGTINERERAKTMIIYYCRLHRPEGRSPTFGHVNLGFGDEDLPEDSQSSG